MKTNVLNRPMVVLAFALSLASHPVQSEEASKSLLANSIALAPIGVAKSSVIKQEHWRDMARARRDRLLSIQPFGLQRIRPVGVVARHEADGGARPHEGKDFALRRLVRLEISSKGEGAIDAHGDGLVSYSIPKSWIAKQKYGAGVTTVEIEEHQMESVVDYVLGISESEVASAVIVNGDQITVVGRASSREPRPVRQVNYNNAGYESAFGNEERW